MPDPHDSQEKDESGLPTQTCFMTQTPVFGRITVPSKISLLLPHNPEAIVCAVCLKF